MKDIRFEELDTDSGQIDPEDEGLLEELKIDDAGTADTADAADDDLFEEFEIGEAAADTKPETVFVKAQEETPEPETEETAEAETAEAAETETVPAAEDAREESKEPEPETEETAEAETAEAAEKETVPAAEDAQEESEEPEPEAEKAAEAEAEKTEEAETVPAVEDAAKESEASEQETEAEETPEAETVQAEEAENVPAVEDAANESEVREPEAEETIETEAEGTPEPEVEKTEEPETVSAVDEAAEEGETPEPEAEDASEENDAAELQAEEAPQTEAAALEEAPADGETDEPLPVKPFWSEEEEEESGPVGVVKLVSFLLLFAVLLAGAYVYGIGYYGTHFLPNTFLDGVNVGELTAAEAKEALRNSFEDNTFELTGRNGASESLDISEAKPSREYEGIEQVLSGQNRIGWIVARKPVKETMLPYTGTFDEEGLERALDASRTLDPANIASPEDAYISFDETADRYVIIPEKPGNAVDREILTKAMQAKIQEGRMQLDLEEIGCYIAPAVSSDNARLQGDLTELNTLQDLNASIDMGGEVTEYLNGEQLRELMTRENAVQDFVTGLKDRYDTYDKDRKRLFKTANGSYILMNAAYGWRLDEEATLSSLLALTDKAADTVGRSFEYEEPVEETKSSKNSKSSKTESTAAAEETDPFHISATWKNKAVVHEEPDYGTTYAEVDLTNQTVYVIQDGVTIFDSPCVSGRMTKDRKTPPGIFDIKLKQTNKTLVGYKPDGSVDYRSPVNYWMPFNGGVGFHDATWRGSFGGTIYVNSGSHGCINMPLAKARELYGIVYKGMPVIVYYR